MDLCCDYYPAVVVLGNDLWICIHSMECEMTPEQIAAVKQALEALCDSLDDVRDCLNGILPNAGYARYDRRIEAYKEQIAKHEKAIADLNTVLRHILADQALDKMAENARKLGLDYEPSDHFRDATKMI